MEQMSVAMSYLQDISDSDLDFIVKTVVTKRQDHDYLRHFLKDKPDFIDIMLDDEKLFSRIKSEKDILIRISPFLLFSILLRKTKRAIDQQSYTMEIIDRQMRIPVFDAGHTTRLLLNKDAREYLARMLASFTRVESATVVYRARGMTYQRHFNELDFDDVLDLASMVEPSYRFPLYKKLADIALFVSGIFSEYCHGQQTGNQEIPARLSGKKLRTLQNYEDEGRRYYDLAASFVEADDHGLRDVLILLADKFTLARKPLNYMVEHYISGYRTELFS
jgi:predicted DNA binding CopG/RHH family protein